jgi:acyl-CoA hydrolase
MTDFKQQYKAKLTTCDALVKQFKPGQVIGLGAWYGEAYGVINALNENSADLKDIFISSAIATCPSSYMENPDIAIGTGFFGPQERAAEASVGNVYYTPINYCDGIGMAKYGHKADYQIYRSGPMDDRGYVNCSMTASADYRVLLWLKENRPETKIVFEVNHKLPRVFGLPEHGNNELHIDMADIIVEDDADPLVYPVPPANETELKIARNVADLVEDRATIQLGFGTLPMAIGAILCERKELGIHTEMFCEAHIDLVEAGAVTNAHKGLYNGLSVATFGLGTTRLHEWMTDNKEIAIIPVEETNRVDVLAKVQNLTSVNSILGVDMTGQTMAHCLGSKTYSGLGGAFEFAYGSQLSPGGKSIVCLPSTTTLKDGTTISNIVAQFPKGTRITVPEHITQWLVTEYGAAHIKFLPLEQRAKALLEITHPDFREPLEKQIRDCGLKLDKIEKLPPFPPGTIQVP